MCYSAVDLSKYIVYKCITEGQPISNLQLQKILYYIQRNFLKMTELLSRMIFRHGNLGRLFQTFIIRSVVLEQCLSRFRISLQSK